MRQGVLTEITSMVALLGERRRIRLSRHALRSATSIAQLIGAALLLSLALQASEWKVGTVPGSVGGKFSSLRMDKFGNAHVCYCDESQGLLQYSFWDHALDRWFNSTVGRCGGFASLVLDSKQHPHISYPGAGNGNVVHVYWDGSFWKTQPIELHATVINYYTSIALDSNDYPTISYYEEQSASPDVKGRLRGIAWNGKFWEVRTVDSDIGSGKFNFMATDSMGNPQIAYANSEYLNLSLRYARWNGHSWAIEILEGKGVSSTSNRGAIEIGQAESRSDLCFTAGQCGANSPQKEVAPRSVAMVLGKDDIPHIAYADANNRILKYATKRNGNWELEAVDSLAGVGYPDRNGIALDRQGNVYISYYDSGRGSLKVAHQKDRKWVVEVVDQSFAGFTSSLQISDANIWVTYASETGRQLKFARRAVEQAEHPAKPADPE